MYDATPESASVAPVAVTVKPPAAPPWKKTTGPLPGQYAFADRPVTVSVVGALGAVVSTLTVVVMVAVLPTLSVPVSV